MPCLLLLRSGLPHGLLAFGLLTFSLPPRRLGLLSVPTDGLQPRSVLPGQDLPGRLAVSLLPPRLDPLSIRSGGLLSRQSLSRRVQSRRLLPLER